MAKKQKQPQYLNGPLNKPMMNYAVYVMSAAERIIANFISFICGGFVGLIFYGGLFKNDGMSTFATYISDTVFFVVVGIVAAKFLVPLYEKRCLDKRNAVLRSQFRDMLESLSASFSTGSNVQKAFEAALEDLKMQYGEKDFIVKEMKEILSGMAQNISAEVMLRDFGNRSGNEDVISFADVFEICYRKGGNMNTVIHRTHSVISEKIAVSDEIETKLTSNKMQHNVMSIMPIGIVAMLRFTNEAFAESFTSPVGIIANTVAIGIFLAAYKYGTKIVDIKE